MWCFSIIANCRCLSTSPCVHQVCLLVAASCYVVKCLVRVVLLHYSQLPLSLHIPLCPSGLSLPVSIRSVSLRVPSVCLSPGPSGLSLPVSFRSVSPRVPQVCLSPCPSGMSLSGVLHKSCLSPRVYVTEISPVATVRMTRRVAS